MSEEESLIGGAIDTVETTFTKGIAGTLFDIAKKVGGSTFKVVGDKRQAGQASKLYAKRYQKRYGLLQLLGMPQGVTLESLYTSVRVLNELSIRQFETIVDLEQNYRHSQLRRLQKGECRREDGLKVAQDNQYLMVLGNPGGGKSTFLRRLGLEAFRGEKGRYKDRLIPVLLELKRFNTESIDLIAVIAEEFQHFGFPPSKEFALQALSTGKLLILLDGLDEVPSQFTNSVMNAIDNLVTSYENNRFVASCRIAAYRSNFQQNFQVIQLADFNDEQIQQFINNWFSTELDKQSETAEKCWKTLNENRNNAAKELAQTPLLLTFLCMIYNRKQSFPPKRSRLYKQALDILLEEWAAEKRLQQEPIHEGLYADLEKVMLAEIAYKGFKDDRLFFDEREITKSIVDFLQDSVDNPKYLDGKKILNSIAIQQGILVQRAEDIYSFSHLTLQEYLTALHIYEDEDLIRQLITQHLTDKRWREVFLLVVGLKNDASKFILAMEKATQDLIYMDKLHRLLVWAKYRANNASPHFNPIGTRAIALTLIYALAPVARANDKVYALALAYALAKANDKVYALTLIYALARANDKVYALTLAYANALECFVEYNSWSKEHQIYQDIDYEKLDAVLKQLQKQIPKENESEETHKSFAKKITQAWLNAFHLKPEMVDLSQQEIQALKDYFHANLLMVECEQAAVRVSRQTWSAIESRMLMPFREPTS